MRRMHQMTSGAAQSLFNSANSLEDKNSKEVFLLANRREKRASMRREREFFSVH